ncbi:gas vesicle protein [Streptomyces sp. NRRL S-118]|uniref:gas vesicle protein n=1 Tax=Streptomyces sp. NRRL S-118 TaxID=1463881 RepID=UPI00099B5EA2|nr:gas vesicle protein [Streptomyces sp. NRRL S-118]
MNEPLSPNLGSFPSRAGSPYGQGTSSNLADILERVLDKGIVIAGDIRIDLLDIELLTIKLRLLVASVDKAKEMGIDWWEHDPSLSSRATERPGLADENRRLREEIAALRSAQELPAAGDRDEEPAPVRRRRTGRTEPEAPVGRPADPERPGSARPDPARRDPARRDPPDRPRHRPDDPERERRRPGGGR